MSSEIPGYRGHELPNGHDQRVVSEYDNAGPPDSLDDTARREEDVAPEQSESVVFKYKIVKQAEKSTLLDEAKFEIPPVEFERARVDFMSGRRSEGSLWSYQMYRDANQNTVQWDYCSDSKSSERVAQQFAKERVLGLKMKWLPVESGKVDYDNVKRSASLIILASESRIGLFHIARHQGDTPEELLAPTLKQILESTEILKTGVQTLACEKFRLEQCFKIKPRGLFELSHLYRLVKVTDLGPDAKVSRITVNLEEQVEQHLRLHLHAKPRDRDEAWGAKDCIDWSVAHLTHDQKCYAANNAYALYQLFRVMDEKRRTFRPTPPLPKFAELKQEVKHADGFYQTTLRFRVTRNTHLRNTGREEEDAQTMQAGREIESIPEHIQADRTAQQSMHPLPTDVQPVWQPQGTASEEEHSRGERVMPIVKEEELPLEPMHIDSATEIDPETLSSLLLSSLMAERMSILDGKMTNNFRPKNDTVASNDDLTCLARERPTDVETLDRIANIGPNAKQYGANWLRVIEHHNRQAESPALYFRVLSSLEAAREEEAKLRRLQDSEKIVKDTILQSMAFERPRNHTALLGIFGIGPKKANDYGDGWLRIIQNLCSEVEPATNGTVDEAAPAPIQPKPEPNTPPQSPLPIPPRDEADSPALSRLSSRVSELHTSNQEPAVPPIPRPSQGVGDRESNAALSQSANVDERFFTVMMKNENGELEEYSGMLRRTRASENQQSDPDADRRTRRRLF